MSGSSAGLADPPPPPPPPQWWTLGTPYRTLAELAGFENKPVDWVQSRLSEESAAADIQQGKAPAQVALDQAALLMVRRGRTHGDIQGLPCGCFGLAVCATGCTQASKMSLLETLERSGSTGFTWASKKSPS